MILQLFQKVNEFQNDISDRSIECVRYGELYNKMIYTVESKTNLDKNELKLS